MFEGSYSDYVVCEEEVHKMKTIRCKIIRIIAALMVFGVEVYLLLGPTAWAGVDKTNWLTGEGAWEVEDKEVGVFFCQEFVPQYDYLQSLSLLFQNDDQDLRGGSAKLWIEDSDGEVQWSVVIPYDRITWESYTDIDVDMHLCAGNKYSLLVDCSAAESGEHALLSICSMDYYMPENKILYYGEEIPDAQLVIRYSYQYTLTRRMCIRVLVICTLTALGLGLGIPQSRKIRKVIAISMLLAVPLILGRQLEFISLEIEEGLLLPNAIHWNVAIMYLFEFIILLCSQSLPFSIISTNLILTVIYSADYFVRSYRSTPLKWNDVLAVRTAARVLDSYDFRPNSNMAVSWAILILLIVFTVQCVNTKQRGQKLRRATFGRQTCLRFVSFVFGILLLVGSGYTLLYTDFLEERGFATIHGFDERMMYQFNGFLVSSCLDFKSSRIVEPEGYSEEKAEEILKRYGTSQFQETDIEDLPHIVLIMNESFADLRVLGNLQISEENMSFFYSLEENTIRGVVNASVLGGGTANSEFEVLLGCSMGLLPRAYYPYQQCIKRPVESLVSDLKEAGYTTYSIHPEEAQNWNRNVIYHYLGFDNSYWIEEFKDSEVIHKGASDRATYRKVQEIYESRKDNEKLFIFDLTLQNHGGYGWEVGYDSIKAVNVVSEEADNFLSLIKESDIALEELITYFKKQDEKVLVCMFGDHQPKFGDENFYTKVYEQTVGLSETDTILNQYLTPFLIWANYDIREETGINISMNYLGVLLQQAAGLRTSSYFTFLRDLMQRYPVITANGYIDDEGRFYEWNEENTEFMEYRILQYYRIF